MTARAEDGDAAKCYEHFHSATNETSETSETCLLLFCLLIDFRLVASPLISLNDSKASFSFIFDTVYGHQARHVPRTVGIWGNSMAATATI